jgi:hypothetical protein
MLEQEGEVKTPGQLRAKGAVRRHLNNLPFRQACKEAEDWMSIRFL